MLVLPVASAKPQDSTGLTGDRLGMGEHPLTDLGRIALALSRNEALFFQWEQVLPEHLLLALAGMPECAAFRILHKSGVYMHLLVREIVARMAFGPPEKSIANPPFSAATIAVLERADAEARALSAKRSAPRTYSSDSLQEQSVASHVLMNRLGVPLDEVRRLAKELADEDPPEGPQRWA